MGVEVYQKAEDCGSSDRDESAENNVGAAVGSAPVSADRVATWVDDLWGVGAELLELLQVSCGN